MGFTWDLHFLLTVWPNCTAICSPKCVRIAGPRYIWGVCGCVMYCGANNVGLFVLRANNVNIVIVNNFTLVYSDLVDYYYYYYSIILWYIPILNNSPIMSGVHFLLAHCLRGDFPRVDLQVVYLLWTIVKKMEKSIKHVMVYRMQ